MSREDILEFDLDGKPVEDRGDPLYGERPIHAAIYEARPDVRAVVHSHSHEVIPFGIANLTLRPVAHVCAPIGASIPVWDICEKFGHTNLLVLDMQQGRDLARCLGPATAARPRLGGRWHPGYRANAVGTGYGVASRSTRSASTTRLCML